jgi:GT2 family glycosyltransferase
LADWFDADLVSYVASQRPSYTFVLVGGVFSPEIAQLQNRPNVKLLGQQPYETMPQYVYDFDVCIIPFKVNSITAATDPVKLYEYLAAGKPIVTTALPELAPYRDFVLMAETHGEFLRQLDKAIVQDDPTQIPLRKALARDNTWAVRYEQIVAGLKNSIPQASIIIVTYNNLALTRLCLESLFRNTRYLNYQVIVVDNNSDDGTQDYLRNLAALVPQLSLILNPQNEGFAKANNQGLRQATGEYLVLLNNDTVVPPGWLSGLLKHLEDHTTGLVGPMTNFVGNEAKLEVPYDTWEAMEAFASKRAAQFAGQFADLHVLAMYCVAMRRDTYAEIGELDEQFGIGMFEDDDYAMRIRQNGCRVICALDVFVHHFGQAAFSKLIQDGTYDPLFAQNKRLFETKWSTSWTPHRHAELTVSGSRLAGKMPAGVKQALPVTLNPHSE